VIEGMLAVETGWAVALYWGDRRTLLGMLLLAGSGAIRDSSHNLGIMLLMPTEE
jgi:hypothetical protein